RKYTAGNEYRYGFNGQEKDDEIEGKGNSYDFGDRIYDARICRWLSLDPMMKKYAGLTPYNFTFNNPIIFKDEGGRDGRLTVDYDKKQVTLETTIFIYGGDDAIDYDKLVTDANNQMKAFDPAREVERTLADGSKETWIVKVNVKFVYAKSVDQSNTAKNIDPSKIDQFTEDISGDIPGFQAGDNVVKVNGKIQMNGRMEGGAGIGHNEASVRGKDPKVIIHEVFHLLGFIDRYIDIPVGMYEDDIMSVANSISQIQGFHFADLLKFALNQKQQNKVPVVVGEYTEIVMPEPGPTQPNGVATEKAGGTSRKTNLEIDTGKDITKTKTQENDTKKNNRVKKIRKPLKTK
ncbi:MAG: RHS repeat-associated core domain-containing protein, partial [Bacteroidia bacterium]